MSPGSAGAGRRFNYEGRFAAHATVYVLDWGWACSGLFYLARRLRERARTSAPPASIGPGAMAAADAPAAARRRLSWELTAWCLGAGFLLGLATELVVEAAGG